jgi:endo-1,4-beta-xylanase
MPSRSTYKNIRTGNKKYCADVYSGSTKDNIPIISYPCHNGTNQQFAYKKGTKQIHIKSSKKCLDVTNKNRVIQNRCNTRKKSQKWNYNPKTKQYISMKNKNCLDVAANKYNNGNLIVYPCHNRNNQKFTSRTSL